MIILRKLNKKNSCEKFRAKIGKYKGKVDNGKSFWRTNSFLKKCKQNGVFYSEILGTKIKMFLWKSWNNVEEFSIKKL